MVEAMRTDFFRGATPMNPSGPGYVEMVADVTEAAVANVIAAANFEAQVHTLRRGRAMNNE